MKKILFLVIAFVIANIITAQTTKEQGLPNGPAAATNKQHKIVFQVMSEDSLVHKSLMKQLKNVLSVAPGTEMEVVCHGPGLSMLVKHQSIVQEQIKQFAAKGVKFAACEFAMAERKVTKDQLVAEAGTVQSGLMEVVTKQESGWSYIKAGF